MDRMTDERLAEIEARHDYASKYFCGNEPHPQAHKHRGELLQALKAERERIRELEQSAAKKDNAIIGYQKRIEELEADSDHYKQRVQDMRTCKVCGQDKVIAEIGAAFGHRSDIMGLKLQELQQKHGALEAQLEEGRKEVSAWSAECERLQNRIRELEAKLDRVQCAADELAGALADD